MPKLIPYKGILQQINDNPPKEVNTSLTEDDFVKWIKQLSKYSQTINYNYQS